MGHFQYLFENGKLNNTDDVKAAYTRVLGIDDLGISLDPTVPTIDHEFIYEMTLNLFRSSDPFGCIARDFADKQNDMLEEEKQLYRENMIPLQKQLKEKCDKDLAEVIKSMNDTCLAKEQELRDLKIAHKQKDIALTALKSQHATLKIKSTAQNGTDGYAQLQKDFKELQAKLKIKEDESELYEKQCILLTDAFLQHGFNLPADVPVDAPAPAPESADPHDPNLIPSWDFNSESRARQELSNHGWGIAPAHAPSPSP